MRSALERGTAWKEHSVFCRNEGKPVIMKYIKDDGCGFTSFDAYFSYLDTVKDQLGERLYAFAADFSRYDLSSKGSLHDAWIRSIDVHIDHGKGDAQDSQSGITLVLIGPYHDRLHTLKYFGVKWSSWHLQFGGHDRYKDLLMHELRFEHGLLQHELEFDGGKTLEIHCLNIEHHEQIL